MKKICGFALTVILVFGGQALWADDVTGHDRFLCSIGDVTMCNMDWECETDSPSRFNIPDFIVFDLEAGLLKTTEARGVLTASASKPGQFSGAFGVCTPIDGTSAADGK